MIWLTIGIWMLVAVEACRVVALVIQWRAYTHYTRTVDDAANDCNVSRQHLRTSNDQLGDTIKELNAGMRGLVRLQGGRKAMKK